MCWCMRGQGCGGGGGGGLPLVPVLVGICPSFLNDSRVVEHLTGVISSTRGSGLKRWPISQLTHSELIV